MSYEIEWRPGAIEDITALFEYLAENASLWDARNVTERLITATDRLADYPRLYETDERYGEGVNRPGFPGECFICELRLPDHRFRWKHNKLFLLLPEEYGPAFPAIVDCYTSPPT
ncbi:putative plasmid stabilisation system protein [Escherichia coli]|mgnify:CR=1 FL=1|uniref:Putative plasmid stabilisation system protein n=4 Tax=Enterobacteriaceae TaxID=543 RepID=A0A376M074_ECOLX|nr:putative plasmid stabilisation system protein [Escherichia coli]